MCIYNRTVFICNHSYLHSLVRSCLPDGTECGTGCWHGLHSRKVAILCSQCFYRQSRLRLLREGMLRCRQLLDRWIPRDLVAELEVEEDLDSLEALSEMDASLDGNEDVEGREEENKVASDDEKEKEARSADGKEEGDGDGQSSCADH